MARRFPRPAGYHWDQKAMEVRADGLRACRWCRGPVHPPRRSWCSDACVEEWTRRTAGQTGCRAVCEARDRGVCAGCGLDTENIRREWKAAAGRSQAEFLDAALATYAGANPRTLRAKQRECLYSPGYSSAGRVFAEGIEFCRRHGTRMWKALMKGSTLWQADHIREIADGGDPIDVSNLQTLCLDCHHAKTVESARARRNKPQGAIP